MGNTLGMSWKTTDLLTIRLEFVNLALCSEANVAELCRRFGLSRKTGYKWIERYKKEGARGLEDRSRRPKRTPSVTQKRVVEEIVTLRGQHPAWGPRKLKRRLQELGQKSLPAGM